MIIDIPASDIQKVAAENKGGLYSNPHNAAHLIINTKRAENPGIESWTITHNADGSVTMSAA